MNPHLEADGWRPAELPGGEAFEHPVAPALSELRHSCHPIQGLLALSSTPYFFFLKITLSKANLDTTDNQPLLPRTVEIQKLAMLNGCMLAVFFLVYILLDSAGSFPFWYTILKIAVCVIVNCIISLVCSKVLFEKFLS